MSRITTHILDTARGLPAAGVAVTLERLDDGLPWREVGRGTTDSDGRLRTLLPDGDPLPLPGASYRLTFETGPYHKSVGVEPFFPSVTIVFTTQGDRHYHVPLLLSPFGYSTYRGS